MDKRDESIKILVAGGDLRQIYLADYLSDLFFVKRRVLAVDFKDCEECGAFDILILPMIAQSEEEFLNAPFFENKFRLCDLCGYLKEGGTVFGGVFSSHAKEIFTSRGFKVFEYQKREELLIKNCIPTAEGALQIAMSELPVTIRGLKVLVAGFGRVGKVTAKLFSDAGAKVTACARKQSDLAMCEALGIDAKKTSEALGAPEEYDLIINTIPSMVIGKQVLEKLKKEVLIIDLASRPGGVDFELAKELCIKTVWALSLPPKETTAKPYP